MEVNILTTLDDQLEKQWRFLWQKSQYSSVFNSFGWVRSATEAFNYDQLCILAIKENNELIGVVPLRKTKIYGVNFLQTISEYAHRSGFLIDLSNQKLVKTVAEKMLQMGNIYLNHLNQEEYTAFSKYLTLHSVHPSFTLQASLKPVEGKKQFMVRKKGQILKKAKEVLDLLTLEKHTTHLDKVITQVFDIDEKSSKKQKEYNVFASEQVREFYQNLINYQPQSLSIYFLLFNTKPVAYEIGFKHHDLYIDSERAIHAENEFFTPGKVLMVKIAEDLAESNFATFDLGPGIDNFKKSLTKEGQFFSDYFLTKNPFVKNYLRICMQLRDKSYSLLFKYSRLYTLYKKLRNTK